MGTFTSDKIMTPPKKVEAEEVPVICQQCILLSEVRLGKIKLQVGTEVWKWIATTVSGALLTALAFWFTLPANSVSRKDMEQYVQTSSPYVLDRQVLLNALKDFKETQIEIKGLQKEMQRQIDDVKSQQTKIVSVLESQGKTIR